MKLIIDCGSTKADWVVLNGNIVMTKFQTEGFNPNYTDKKHISSIISNNLYYNTYIQDITTLYFYGTGCGNTDNCNLIKDIFKTIFRNSDIIINNDMIGACHALLGNKNGIACILGTGSNSCHYDGEKIIEKAVSLGYIIGDEGGGNHIGKQLIHDYFYKTMPAELSESFEKEYDINIGSFIENIYHKPQVSRYLASFCTFAYDNKEHDYIKNLCLKSFDEFLQHFVLKYETAKDTDIKFVGSIAYYFQDILKQSLENKGLKLGKIIKKPIDGLIEFHSQD